MQSDVETSSGRLLLRVSRRVRRKRARIDDPTIATPSATQQKMDTAADDAATGVPSNSDGVVMYDAMSAPYSVELVGRIHRTVTFKGLIVLALWCFT
jgi:hypothetical protein